MIVAVLGTTDVHLLARTQVFHTLAAAFQYPAGHWQNDLETGRFLDDLTAGIENHPDQAVLEPLLADVRCSLTESAAGEDAPRRSLALEYTHLFLRQARVPLSETSYGLDLTFARTRDLADVGAYHRAFGFTLAPDTSMLPDHLSVQLEFLAVLCAKEAYARSHDWQEEAGTCLDARARYLTEHLTGWLPSLAERMAEHARLSFYPAVTALAREAVRLEHRAVGGGRPRVYGEEPGHADDNQSTFDCGGCPALTSWDPAAES